MVGQEVFRSSAEVSTLTYVVTTEEHKGKCILATSQHSFTFQSVSFFMSMPDHYKALKTGLM